jgi:hypothetical protein
MSSVFVLILMVMDLSFAVTTYSLITHPGTILSTLDFYWWGHTNDLMYQQKMKTQGDLPHGTSVAVTHVEDDHIEVMRAAQLFHICFRIYAGAESAQFELYCELTNKNFEINSSPTSVVLTLR